jgi:hypothetical protein
MIATLPTQQQVDEIARDLAPDVVRIRVMIGHDWSEHPAIYFRVVLSDDASRRDRLAGVVGAVRSRMYEKLALSESNHIPYFKFRSEGEQSKLQDAAWDLERIS